MSLSNDVKEHISLEVIYTLVTRFETFPEDASNNRNAPFHEAFLKAFRLKLEDKVTDIPFFISLSSWLQGLNTTLGQVFFENVAHHLSHGEKREYTSKKLGNLKIYKEQKDIINNIITDLSTSSKTPNITEENKLLFIKGKDNLVDAIDFSVDVFIEDENNITAIELKSVKPNSGEMRGEKQKILEGKAALYKKFSNKSIQFYIGFESQLTMFYYREKTEEETPYTWETVSSWKYDNNVCLLYNSQGTLLDTLQLDLLIEDYVRRVIEEKEETTQKTNTLLTLTEKDDELLEMLRRTDMDADSALTLLHISQQKLDAMIHKLIELDMLQYIAPNEVKLTEKGLYHLSENKHNE